MTTPGGENLIQVGVEGTIVGDAAALARELGLEVSENLRSVLSGAPIELPPVDASATLASLTRMESEFRQRIANLRETVAGAGSLGAGGGAGAGLGAARWSQELVQQMRTQQRAFLEAGGQVPAAAGGGTGSAAATTRASEQVSTAVGRLAQRIESLLPRLDRDYGQGEQVSGAERLGVLGDRTARFGGLPAALTASGGQIAVLDQMGRVVQLFDANLADAADAGARLAQAQQTLIASTEEVAASQRAAAGGSGGGRRRAGQAVDGGGEGGPFHSFITGFRGAGPGESVLGQGTEFLGAIARYQLAYNVIYRLGQGFHDLVGLETQTQDASLELAHALQATGSNAEQVDGQVNRLNASLTAMASAMGQSPVAGIQAAAAGVFAFGDQIRAGRATGSDAAQESAAQAMNAQVLTGQQLDEVQHNLLASTLAFNLGVSGQARVLDAATASAHRFGGSIGDILQALPNVGEIAQATGFSLEQTASLVALIGSRTGQNANSAGTQLTRIIAQIQTPAVQSALRGVGVSTGQTPEAELQQLAGIYPHLGQDQRAALVRSVTGARGANALGAILNEGPSAFTPAGEAGFAQRHVLAQLDTFGGEIRQLGGDFRQTGEELAQSGLLNIFGEAVLGLKDVAQALNLLLAPLDALDHTLGGKVGITIAEDVAAFLLLNHVLAALRTKAAEAAAATEAQAAADGEQAGAAAAGGRLARFGGLGIGQGRTRMGEFSLGRFGLLAGTAAVLGVGAVWNARQEQNRAEGSYGRAVDSFRGARTANDFSNAAAQLGAAAQNLEHSSRLTVGTALSNLLGVTSASHTMAQAAAARDAAQLAQNDIQDLKRNAASTPGLISRTGDPSIDLGQALSGGLLGSGADAVAQNRALVAFLQGNAPRALNRSSVAISLSQAAAQSAPPGDLLGLGVEAATRNAVAHAGPLNQQTVQNVARTVGEWVRQHDRGTAAQANVVVRSILQRFSDIQGEGTGGNSPLTSEGLQQLLFGAKGGKGQDTLSYLFQQQASRVNTLDPTAQTRLLGSQASTWQAAINRARAGGLDRSDPDTFRVLVNTADQTISQYVQGRVQELQAIAQSESQRAGSPAGAAAVQLQGLIRSGQVAAQRGDEGQLATLIDQMNTYQADHVRNYIEGRIRSLRNQLRSTGSQGRADLQGQLHNYQQSLAAFGQATPTDATYQAREQILESRLGARADPQNAVQQAQIQIQVAQSAAAVARQHHDEDAYYQAEQSLHNARFQLVQAQLEHSNAELEATQVPGSQISAALVQIQEARAAMSAYERGSTAWWHALGQLNQAEYQLSQAQAQYAGTAYLATHDTTNPVNVAIAALDQAHRQLAVDRAQLDRLRRQGADPREIRAQHEVVTADIVAQRQAAAQVQSARFQQRFTDVQNAHSLLLISDQAYMNYLEAQDRSLRHQIAGMRVGSQGYRAAVDELTQIDQAIMAANSALAGQFNLGQIHVPTVYQVRDSLAAQRAGLGYGPEPASAQTISIELLDMTDGGIRAKGVLTDALGGATVVRTPTRPNKVIR